MSAIFAALATLLAAAPVVVAQAPPAAPAVGGTAQARSLDFAAAEVRYEQASKALRRARDLHEQDLSSEAELEEAEVALRLAELELGRAYLGLVSADPQVVLSAARKYQMQDRGARVEVELVARSSYDDEAQAVESGRSTTVELPVLKGVSNVVVSLKKVGGYQEGILSESTIVSVPYETRLPLLRFDEAVTIDFGLLLPDVQELLVELRYNGKVDRRQVLLGKRSGTEDTLIVRSNYVTLDAELGEDAVYKLEVERFEDADAVYDFRLEGLPPEVSVRLSDPESEATFSQIFFAKGKTDLMLDLALNMPSRPTPLVQPDRTIVFSMFLVRSGLTAASAAPEAAGSIELQVIPRGVAELELNVPNLYHEVRLGESVGFDVEVVNAGSRTLEQVELTVEVPFGWHTDVKPMLFASLDAGASEVAAVALTAPADQILGDYEGSIGAATLAGDRLVEAEPKTFRLHVSATGSPLLATILGLAVVGVLASVILGGIRLSRR